MKADRTSLETRLIHAGEPRPRVGGAVVLPIFQSSTYDYVGEMDYHDVPYIRLNNSPNHEALHAKLAAIESAEAALVTSSGMAAISSALLTVLGAGDHLLAQDCLYGGTHGLLTKDLPDLGIRSTFIDAQDPASWERALTPETRAIYVETLTNPLLEVADLEAVPAFAKAHGLVSMIDNTFASPVAFRPTELGFDLVLESCTKFMNGHGDIAAGALAGRAGLIERIKKRVDHLGGTLDPHACFLLHRGLKTLAVRVREQSATALRLATFLDGHDAVESVRYPGLASHAQHGRAKELFDGFGGMIAFELRGGAEAAERMFSRAELPIVAVSLGGTETLWVRPAAAIHQNLTPEERLQSGIGDGLVRMSVGLEGAGDLVADLGQALR